PRDYRFKLNKKLKDLARRSALSLKAAAGEIIVVDNVTFEAPKTKEYINFAKNIKVEGKKVLLVLSEKNNNVLLSMRNVPDARLMAASDINTYAVLNNNALVLTEGSVDVLNKL
ncbi:MAG: 50S ribosomal protein L4, partial [Muribaculaceae bacterium]|nr:50S ribosomal protein L4 [Muribaculaceae bacterium]